MSSKPTSASVSKVLTLVTHVEALAAEISSIRKQIDRLKVVEDEHAKAARELWETISGMDLFSGNTGYAQRMAWVIGEIRRQLINPVSFVHTTEEF